jgi:hypothetical protein
MDTTNPKTNEHEHKDEDRLNALHEMMYYAMHVKDQACSDAALLCCDLLRIGGNSQLENPLVQKYIYYARLHIGCGWTNENQ